MVLLDTGTPGTTREIYNEDADDLMISSNWLHVSTSDQSDSKDFHSSTRRGHNRMQRCLSLTSLVFNHPNSKTLVLDKLAQRLSAVKMHQIPIEKV